MSEELITWDLSDFYESIEDPKIDKDIVELRNLASAFNQSVKGKLKDPSLSAEQLLIWFTEYESISERVFYLYDYASLSYSTNNLNDKIKSFYSKIDEFKAKIQADLLFFELELNQLPNEKMEQFSESQILKQYSHALKFNMKKKPHQLSEKEEQVILMKDITGVKGFLKFYSEFKSNFLYDFEVDGVMKKLTEAALFAYMYHANKELRYEALRTIVTNYESNELVFTHIFNNILKDWGLECDRRKYISPIARRNLDNEVSDQIVEILGEVSASNYHIVEKYYNLKKKLLKLPEMRMSDIYAPLGEISKKFTYLEALDLIKNVDEQFHPEFKQIVEKVQLLNHIDVTPRKGKNRGAFCEFGKLKHYPFVFVNFTETIDSVLTLAHELGHAIHSFYIQRDQNFMNLGISLAIAEMASVFNEILVFDSLMNYELAKEEKIALLCVFIENNFATSFRQNAFYRFEKKIHSMLAEKLPTSQEIKDTFAEEMQLMFGNSINNIKQDYASYCFVIPHFLNDPFYVYAYNMSNLLVISLYQLYLENESTIVPRYLKLLSMGNSVTPEEMLADIGINLNDPSFWQKGIDYLAKKISELEKLIE
jgi:oligoendopeptidase F